LIFYIKPDPWKSNFIQPSERSKYKYTPSGIPYDLSQSSISDNIFCYQEKFKKRKEQSIFIDAYTSYKIDLFRVPFQHVIRFKDTDFFPTFLR